MINLTQATFGYSTKPSVQGLSFTLEKGAFCALVGGNGSGKSTLLKGLAGLIKPMHGTCTVQGAPHFLAQQAELNLNFPLSLQEFLHLGAQEKARIPSALKLMKLSAFTNMPLNTLSGGQLQRTIFARLMLSNAPILLLDEPFSMMDAQTTLTCLDYLKTQAKSGRVVVCVLHDYDLVRHYFPQTLIVAREMLAFGKTSEVLTPDLMHKAHKL